MKRLEELLRSSKLSLVSKRSHIAESRLALLARGEEPTYPEMLRLAAALNVDVEQLAPLPAEAATANLLFRTSGGREPNPLITDTLSRKISYALELLSEGDKRGSWEAAFEGPKESYLDAEALSISFRNQFYGNDQASPMQDLANVLTERLGVIIFVISSAAIDGASAFISDVPFVFVSSRFEPRMLFTIAHELGHLISADRTQYALIDNWTNLLSRGKARSQQERFAHAFASCLLMPRQGIGVALQKIRSTGGVTADEIGDVELLLLSRIFGVSFEAAARRCEDLSLLPPGGAASLNNELKIKYGSAEKRADLLKLPPRYETHIPRVSPMLLRSAVDQVRSGKMSIGRAATVLGISVSDLVLANAEGSH